MIALAQRRLLLACVLLVLPSIGARAAVSGRVELEIATEPGLPVGSEQAWYQTLTALGATSVRLRGAMGGEKVEVRTLPGLAPTYHVIAVLTARNQLLVPGHRFQASDRAGLAAWIERLQTAGPEVAGSTEKLPFDLASPMLAEARAELRRPVAFKTLGREPWSLLGPVQGYLVHLLRVTTLERDELQHAGPVEDELLGLSCGTVLAALLRPAGLAFAPRRSQEGELEYRIFQPVANSDIWPIGWPAEERRRQLVPKLFEFLNLEVSNASVRDAVEAVRQRLGIPLLYDRNALARHGIDPAAIAAELPKKRISYSLALQKLLFQARLKMELRVDEADRPFLWVTSVKPLD